MNDLFPDAPIPEKKKETCRSCEHRQAWQCNSKVIQYCGIKACSRTDNGLLKIKVTNEACVFYEKGNKNDTTN